MKVDVMLLYDIFKKFRNLCLETYGLDPSFYYTAPVMFIDRMFKHTKVKLELLSDYNKILMFKMGIRGGFTQAVTRYSKANNCNVPSYNSSKPYTWITYLDASNLYV